MLDKKDIKDNDHSLNGTDPGDIIVAIDYVPLKSTSKGFQFKLNPARAMIVSALVVFSTAAWFVLSAKSIFIDITPLSSELTVHRLLALKIGPRYLMTEGPVDISINSEGYYPFEASLDILDSQAQTFQVELVPLSGFLTITTPNLIDANIIIDGNEVGLSPIGQIELAAGEHSVVVQKARYQPLQQTVQIQGRTIEQDLTVELLANWAEVSFTTSPLGASISINGEELGESPLSLDLLAGENEILVKLEGHKAQTQTIEVIAREDMVLSTFELIEADGLALLQSSPSNAGVTMDGVYQGQTPIELTIAPGQSHQLAFFINGYQELQTSIQTQANEESALRVTLEPILSDVNITAFPSEAQLYINGEHVGSANQTLSLLAAPQHLEVRLDGYVPYEAEFTSRPGLEQSINVRLISLEQQRLDSIQSEITNASGQSLKLLYPSPFVMGASRREAGRQANEILRNIILDKPFYLSLTEVTNAQFAMYNTEHSSGVLAGKTLSNPTQPVVQISWQEAALYCNWLSQQESLPLFYIVEGGNIVASDPDSNGYRLPTEAEWAWAARVDDIDQNSLLKFPWGAQLPPPENHGNYADISAASILGRIIVNYNDSFIGTAPVASFEANINGFYDLGGNVAEWVHDFYGANSTNVDNNPFGPTGGTYHVVRGSSWAHGTVTELRLSYRDYSDERRDDIGFRVARNLQQ